MLALPENERLPLHVIETQEKLTACLPEIKLAPWIAFDLEFDRDRYSYGFDLCLMQLSTDKAVYIIDPLTVTDLTALWAVFEDASIRKLVHCPGEDLRLLHSLGCFPQNIADTEVVAKLLNYEQTSLSNLLSLKCGVTLNKKLQKSNWHHRPLTADQIKYAADDVIYLATLYSVLELEAFEKNRMPMVLQEFEMLQTVRHILLPKTDFLKPRDRQLLSPWQQDVLNKMMLWRDEEARKRNKPAHQIMPEELVRQFALGELPLSALSTTKGVHPALQRGPAAQGVQDTLAAIFEEANEKGLKTEREREPFTHEARRLLQQRKAKQDRDREQIFTPIQKALGRVYGEHATRYMISNAWINRLLQGDTTLKQLQPPYKQDLIRAAAHHLNLDLKDYQ